MSYFPRKPIVIPESASDPNAITNAGLVYTKDDSGISELYYQNDSSFITQITRDGSINGFLNVLDFGAVPTVLGGGDAIQDAIDTMIADQDKYLGIIIPPGVYSITRPLMIFRDTTFVRVSMVSAGRFGLSGAGFGGTIIKLEGDGYQDWPVMIVQGGRGCYFEGISFYNTGNTAPYDNLSAEGTAAHFVYPDLADWIGAGTRSNARSPNCCVAIDPFTDGYPDLDINNAYPGFEDYYGGSALNTPTGSSDTIFRYCTFYGGFVGVASSPPGNVGAGDAVFNNENNQYDHCYWLYNTYHYASGQSQERSNTIRECMAAGSWCVISTEAVGPGGNPGNCPFIYGLNIGHTRFVFDINAINRVTISNLYLESSLSLGKICVGAAGIQGGAKIDGITASFLTSGSAGASQYPDVPFHLHSFGMVTIDNAILNTNNSSDNFLRFWNTTGRLILNRCVFPVSSTVNNAHVQLGFQDLTTVRGTPWQTYNPNIGAIYHDDPTNNIQVTTLSGNPAITVNLSGDAGTGVASVSNTGGLEVGDLLKINADSPTAFAPQVISATEFAYGYQGPIGVITNIDIDSSITIDNLPYGFTLGSSYRFGVIKWVHYYPDPTTLSVFFKFFFDPVYEVRQLDGITDAGDLDIIGSWSSQDTTGQSFSQPDLFATFPIYDADVTTINHQPALLFDNVDGYHLAFDGAKSVTNFLHNGTGATLSIGFIHTDAGAGTILTSLSGSDSNIGIEVITDGYGDLNVLCGRGSAGYVFNSNSAGVLNDGYFHVVTIRHKTGNSPEFDIRVDGVSVDSGSYSNAASASDSTDNLTMGAYPDYSSAFGSHIYAIMGDSSFLSDTKVQGFEDRLFNRVGQ